MSQRRLHTLLEGGSFFESPRWHQGRWWVSDFYRHEVLAVEPDGRAQTVLEVAGRPSGLGWMPDGSLLVVSMADRRILRVTAGDVSLHADVSAYCGGDLNDMVVASDGRLYAGNFGFDSAAQADPVPASLICVDPGGSARVAADGLHFPNGSVIAPDGRTLIVGETGASRYTAFTIEPGGALSGRRTWAQVAPAPELTTFADTLAALRFGPDGCTLDADGHIWAADMIGARCARLAPGGAIVDEIAVPDGRNCFACMLGGDDGRTLLICAARGHGEQLDTHDAVLLTTTVAVPHAGLP
jgi:sugar lactone lactonase YvrE